MALAAFRYKKQEIYGEFRGAGDATCNYGKASAFLRGDFVCRVLFNDKTL